MELNLIIPAGGKSSRYNHGKPKWLRTHPDGDLMIEHAVSALTSKAKNLISILLLIMRLKISIM